MKNRSIKYFYEKRLMELFGWNNIKITSAAGTIIITRAGKKTKGYKLVNSSLK